MDIEPNASRVTLGELRKHSETITYKILIKWLNERIWEIRAAGDSLDAPAIYRNQGRVLEIRSLIKDLSSKRAEMDDRTNESWTLD